MDDISCLEIRWAMSAMLQTMHNGHINNFAALVEFSIALCNLLASVSQKSVIQI